MYSPIFLRYSLCLHCFKTLAFIIFLHDLRAFLRGRSEKFEACRSLAGEVHLERHCFGETGSGGEEKAVAISKAEG
jgi:hypothetical protein